MSMNFGATYLRNLEPSPATKKIYGHSGNIQDASSRDSYRKRLLDRQADAMLRLKVRRLEEHNKRICEDFDRPRIYASEACQTIIESATKTDDLLIPCPWLIENGTQQRDGHKPRTTNPLHNPEDDTSAKCCIIA